MEMGSAGNAFLKMASSRRVRHRPWEEGDKGTGEHATEEKRTITKRVKREEREKKTMTLNREMQSLIYFVNNGLDMVWQRDAYITTFYSSPKTLSTKVFSKRVVIVLTYNGCFFLFMW